MYSHSMLLSCPIFPIVQILIIGLLKNHFEFKIQECRSKSIKCFSSSPLPASSLVTTRIFNVSYLENVLKVSIWAAQWQLVNLQCYIVINKWQGIKSNISYNFFEISFSWLHCSRFWLKGICCYGIFAYISDTDWSFRTKTNNFSNCELERFKKHLIKWD